MIAAVERELGSNRGSASTLLTETKSYPIALLSQTVFVDAQRLLYFRPELKGRHQQIHFAVAVQVVSNHVATVFLQCHSHEVAHLEERVAAAIEVQPVLLISTIRLAAATGPAELSLEIRIRDGII